MSDGTKAVRVIVSGRVQGVGFRAWTKSTARKAKLNGWVRNRTDKTVEAVFSGKEAAIDEMVKACKNGPLASRVTELHVTSYTESVKEGFEALATV